MFIMDSTFLVGLLDYAQNADEKSFGEEVDSSAWHWHILGVAIKHVSCQIRYHLSIQETEWYQCNPVHLNESFLKGACDIQETMKSTRGKSPKSDRPLNSELLSYISEIKGKFAETLISLDLVESYLQWPSEETAKQLKLLFDRGKCTSEETYKTFKRLQSFLNINSSTADDNENGNESLDCHLDCEGHTCSISEESLRKEKKREELSPTLKTLTRRDKEIKNGPGKTQDKKRLAQEYALLKQRELDYISQLEARIELLEQENSCLRKKLESSEIENKEILSELGKVTVEISARESEGRKSELFERIFRRSSPEAKPYVVNNHKSDPEDDMLGYPNDSHPNGNGLMDNYGFRKPQTINESGDPSVNASNASTASHVEQSVQGAEALVQRNNHQPGKDEAVIETVITGKNESKLQDRNQDSASASIYQNNSKVSNPAMQDLSSITSGEKASGGEGNSESGSVKETNVLASISKEENLSYSVQQDDSSGREYISLGYKPPRSVATTLYNNYKLLLLSLAQRLLSSEVVKLKGWASQNFAIENAQNATDVLFQLDEKRIINGSDLSALSDFFESIVRFDLVYIIDAFLLGDYSLLRRIPASKKCDANRAQNPQYGSTSRYASVLNTLSSSQASSRGSREAGRYAAPSGSLLTNTDRNPATSKRNPENSNGPQSSVPQQKPQPAFPNISPFSNTNNPKLVSRSPNENQSTAHEQQNPKTIAPGFTEASAVFVDGPLTNERMTRAGNSSTRTTSSNTSITTNPPVTNNPRKAQTVGSNGLKLSKFQRPDADQSIVSHVQFPGTSRNRDLDLESNWLCSHYKRVCYVKFECCDKFWPCHRCHNNQSTCGRKKLKSRDTQMLKCVYCNKVQQFGEFCCECGTKFANYFCGLCKHLTGKDDHPYHCEKCGICRIHGDRSFHCDVCGVCLDVQLRGNHKCREGSAHDECCICLEDAFTGCQILPCSHKVHKECATQMIRSGITRCPICRESFAHKLERRPLPNSRKRSGK